MIELSDQDLLLRLRNFEDSFVERKSSSDKGGWLRTVVAFANSAPVGAPGVLFIGVADDGTIQSGINLEVVQQTFSSVVSGAYPPIATFPKVLEQDGKQFLAVIVPGSPERPHFAGQAYIRDGSETKKASEAQFAELIAQRNSKQRELLKWKGKGVLLRFHAPFVFAGYSYREGGEEAILEDCNQFYVTLQARGGRTGGKDSISLRFIELSFDHVSDRLRLEVMPP